MNSAGVVGRRGFLRAIGMGALGASAFGFTDVLTAHADDLRKRHMACILLWMQGGPSQFETFDPKPEHTNGGETKSIETSVPGIFVAEGWENTAKIMHQAALIRSLTNREGNHQRATYQIHTGYLPTGTLKHPSIGSNVAAELGDPNFDLPHFVSIGGPTLGAGFLGVPYEPFVLRNPQQAPPNVQTPVGPDRFRRRLGLLGSLENVGFARSGGYDRVKDHQGLYDKAGGMVLSPRVDRFDLKKEEDATRDAYGRNAFGQGCLLARRLVEAGVAFVEVVCNGWDTHENNNQRVGSLAGQVDPAMSRLITDLKERGLLERTLVVWMGEFGRTPKINGRAGRDHFPRCFSALMVGGGVKGGQVIGASSPDGTSVKDRPVSISDLLSTFCLALKIDPKKENMSPVGRPIKIVDGGKPVVELFA